MASRSTQSASVRIASMIALCRALTAAGGAVAPREAYEWIRSNTDLEIRIPAVTKLTAANHFEREIRFARQELAEAGLLATSQGEWRLLDANAAEMTIEQAREITRQNTRRRRWAKHTERPPEPSFSVPGALPRPSTGPRPVDWQGTVTRSCGPTNTYLFRFEGTNLWKIGFAMDVEARLREVNRHVPVELLDGRWILVRTQIWPSAELAYHMEQRILTELTSQITVYERVQCLESEMFSAWLSASEKLARTDRRPQAE